MGFPGKKKKSNPDNGEVTSITATSTTTFTAPKVTPIVNTKNEVLDFLENNLKVCEKAIADCQEKLGKAEKDSVLRGVIIAQINHELTGKSSLVAQIQLQQ